MIDVREAVQIARAKAAEMLEQTGTLEEVERDQHQGREVWSITLGFPPKFVGFSVMSQYKRFLIDAETGELLAMKLRELASQ
jgi:hypothetical protein